MACGRLAGTGFKVKVGDLKMGHVEGQNRLHMYEGTFILHMHSRDIYSEYSQVFKAM